MPDLSPVSASSAAVGSGFVGQGESGRRVGGAAAHGPPGRPADVVIPAAAAGRTKQSPEPSAPRICLDHLASTPCDPEAAALVQRLAVEAWANPSSPHRAGRLAARHVERAREQVAAAIDALPEEIVFTSGATEANNLAILGVAAAVEREALGRAPGDGRRRLLTLGIEHPSVLAPIAELARRGFDVEHVTLQPDGRVDLDALADRLEGALLLSIQAANNEIGTLQPLAEASRMAAEHGVLVHGDAAQILGKLPFSVEELDLDFASLSAHKCYGPKGIGALWIRGGARRAPIAPITFGGSHESGLRPGTPNAPAIAGFGLAVELASERMERDAKRLGVLRDRLEQELAARLGDRVRLNGALGHRLPHATSLTFFDPDGRPLDADALVANLPEFDLSTASACHAGTPEPSHVLRAIGMAREEAYATLRVGLGRGVERAEVDRAAERIVGSPPLRHSSSRHAKPRAGGDPAELWRADHHHTRTETQVLDGTHE